MTPRPAGEGTMSPKECAALYSPVIRAHRLTITSLITALTGLVSLALTGHL